MDVNELVRTIAAEVLKQIQGQEKKDCVVILADRDSFSTERLRESLGGEADIFYYGEDTHGRTACRYILPSLSCNDMADLATGRANGPCMNAVLDLLLHGTEVEVLEFGHRAYSETAPGPLYRLYESYMHTLAGFGLKSFQQKRPDFVRFWQTLVTEKVIIDAEQQGTSVVQVPVDAQITPLAFETARNLKVNIQKCL
jgi:hypothetical protein